MEEIAAIVSAVVAVAVAVIGAMFWYIDRREKSLRREDVLSWANEAITALQSTTLICMLDGKCVGPNTSDRACELVFDTSALIERGRLFFRNVVTDDFGADKHPAYRGYRPVILDPLVVAHQVACAWQQADEATRCAYGTVMEDQTKRFVSLVRAEVGRDRTYSGGVAAPGIGVHLPHLVAITQSPDRPRGWL